MSCEIPDGFYDFDEVVREAYATYTPEELARECELEERAEEQLERAELVYAMRAGTPLSALFINRETIVQPVSRGGGTCSPSLT
nr:hypothetical protein [uncultured Actinomyces sp.]